MFEIQRRLANRLDHVVWRAFCDVTADDYRVLPVSEPLDGVLDKLPSALWAWMSAVDASPCHYGFNAALT